MLFGWGFVFRIALVALAGFSVLRALRRRSSAAFPVAVLALAASLVVLFGLVPPVARWVAGGAIDLYVVLLILGAGRSRRDALMAGALPRPFVKLVSTELRLAGFAARAPKLMAARRPRSAATYAESSKWESLAIIVLVAFVPDTVLLWLIPLPLWGHVVVVLADAYASMWLVGAYGSVVLMMHEPWSDPVVLRNGIFAEVELPREAVASVEVLEAAEQAAVRKRDAIARGMSVPGTRMVRVRLRGDAVFRPLFGAARVVSDAVYASSDEPEQLAHAIG